MLLQQKKAPDLKRFGFCGRGDMWSGGFKRCSAQDKIMSLWMSGYDVRPFESRSYLITLSPCVHQCSTLVYQSRVVCGSVI
jgi:hypothetical protein